MQWLENMAYENIAVNGMPSQLTILHFKGHNKECYPPSYDTLDFLCPRWAN